MENRVSYSRSFDLWGSKRSGLYRSTANITQYIGLAGIAVCIAVLYAPVTRWTLNKFYQSSTHWHWYVAAIAIVCAMRSHTGRLQPGVNNNATCLLLLCTILEIANQQTLQIQLLSAVLLIVTLHAYTGHLVDNRRWMATKWPVVVGVALLPLDFYLEPYLGYPLRLLSASVAQVIIQGIGFDAITSQSILLVENRASVVDLDCSGINSLWAGTVFFLLLSWLTRLAVGFRWWLLGLLLVVLLLCSNVFRIVVLVVLDVYELPGFSEIAHTALSALGFTVAILVVWKCAESLPKAESAAQVAVREDPALHWRWPLMPVIALLLIGASIAPNDNDRGSPVTHEIVLPSSIHATPMALHAQEDRFFHFSGAHAQKYRLGSEEHDNSVVLVSSSWWKAQHKPDHCLQAMGLVISNSRVITTGTHPVTGAIQAVTVLDLQDIDNKPYTAIYWFQSTGVITADHFSRVADSFAHGDRRWTMVSMLLGSKLESDQVTAMVDPVQQAVANSYKENL